MDQLAELKQRARKTWAAGDFPTIASRIQEVGKGVVAAAEVGPEDRVLDVACGNGNATFPAARRARETVGLDITPELLHAGREQAEREGIEIEWVEGDAEDLPFEDGDFDVVVSTFGCMFAPRHKVAAAEIARVMRPGGRMALACWTPTGFVGEMFRTTASHVGPPPPPAQPPPLWGVPEHTTGLFAGTGVEPRFETQMAHWKFDSVDAAIDEFTEKFGPLVMARAALEPEGRWDALVDDLRALWSRHEQPDGTVAYGGEYLLITGEKAG